MSISKERLVEIQMYAFIAHANVNHKYGDSDLPYSFHLAAVVATAKRYRHLIPAEDFNDVVAGCYCHDIIEDARESYNDVKKKINKLVAEIAFACSNDKGRNRKERAGEPYYKGIREQKYASFVKLCDRIANGLYSKMMCGDNPDSMFYKYKAEHIDFIVDVVDSDGEETYYEMIAELSSIFN